MRGGARKVVEGDEPVEVKRGPDGRSRPDLGQECCRIIWVAEGDAEVVPVTSVVLGGCWVDADNGLPGHLVVEAEEGLGCLSGLI